MKNEKYSILKNKWGYSQGEVPQLSIKFTVIDSKFLIILKSLQKL